MNEAEPGTSQEASRPPIAEKVQFWQEQDRINKALIPRVMKMHDLVNDCIQKVEDTTAVQAKFQAETRNEVAQLKQVLEREIADIRNELKNAMEAQVNFEVEARNEFEQVRQMLPQEIKSMQNGFRRIRIQALGLGLSGLVVAIASLTIALLR